MAEGFFTQVDGQVDNIAGVVLSTY